MFTNDKRNIDSRDASDKVCEWNVDVSSEELDQTNDCGNVDINHQFAR